ncbi:hypothetical protein [Pseudomonas syringae]|uniref:hypothetical protein n=1 Tax=Pseudomonas syringae TaxID=317 RepID=UPI001F2522AD|nr:hypothetical protein [Pseudomonas syringae]MCF5372020.1 hypothetical protein [Pseudomonas syringae]
MTESGSTKFTAAARDVLAERRRQIDQEGYSFEHDDAHANGQIASAAADYAMPGQHPIPGVGWASNKTKRPRRDQLVKAGALVLAEIERLDRVLANTRMAKEL